MGVQLSVDDVGTNWSSFEPFKRHAVSTVKIDGSFIAGLEPTQGINRLVVETVIHMAHSLGHVGHRRRGGDAGPGGDRPGLRRRRRPGLLLRPPDVERRRLALAGGPGCRNSRAPPSGLRVPAGDGGSLRLSLDDDVTTTGTTYRPGPTSCSTPRPAPARAPIPPKPGPKPKSKRIPKPRPRRTQWPTGSEDEVAEALTESGPGPGGSLR